MSYDLHYLKQLEAEAVHIIREAASEFNNPVMLYSIGKDSSVLLHLAKKAFYPGKIPFPLMHIDTGYKFREMIEFREKVKESGVAKDLLVSKNTSPEAMAMTPLDANTETYIYHKKTIPLLEGIKKYGFDCAFGGARRDEEKSRAKERIFSIRDDMGRWDPKNQRPELWHNYNARLKEGENIRVFPMSNWTEVDIWTYIKQENIEIVPLYYAQKREVVMRGGCYLRVDEYVQPQKGEEVIELMCRYRTLGCSPSTGAIPSDATTLEEIILEVLAAKKSERETRMIDQTSEASMEKKKKEGYF